MSTISAGHSQTEKLPKGQRMTVTMSADGTGSVVRLTDPPGTGIVSTTAVAASATDTFGPYANDTYFDISCTEGTLTFTNANVAFEAADESAKGGIATFDGDTDGTVTLLAAAPEDRVVMITVHVTEVFANGDGAQPTLLVGETGDTDKFAAAAVFTDAADESKISLVGTLSADASLLLTHAAGTGTTETGSGTVAVIAAPLT